MAKLNFNFTLISLTILTFMSEKMQGVKSKEFGVYWKTFFMTAMCYPEHVDKTNPKHMLKMKRYKLHFNNISYSLPCKFCAQFTRNVLMKKYPLDFSGRVALLHSLYLWKDRVNKKLLKQGCTLTKPSPPFKKVLKYYEGLRAVCDKKAGKCV
jgi:hypothetical protein